VSRKKGQQPSRRREPDYVLAERRRRHKYRPCYECCQGRGGRCDLWDRLCPVCRKLTRADACHGYMTIVVNPRIRVPRLEAKNRWRQFLKKYPKFDLSRGVTVTEFEKTTAEACHA